MFHQKWISLLSVGPWNSRTVVPSPSGPPRSAEDTSPPQVMPLPVCCVPGASVRAACRLAQPPPPTSER